MSEGTRISQQAIDAADDILELAGYYAMHICRTDVVLRVQQAIDEAIALSKRETS